MEYGKRHEPDAIAAYEQYKKLENGTVNKVGIILSEERPGYGTSLDGMVTLNGVTSGIECKCPASKEDKTIQEACSDPNFCLQCDENENLIIIIMHRSKDNSIQAKWNSLILLYGLGKFVMST